MIGSAIVLPLRKRIKGNVIEKGILKLLAQLPVAFPEREWNGCWDFCPENFTFEPRLGLEHKRDQFAFTTFSKPNRHKDSGYMVYCPPIDPNCYYYELAFYVAIGDVSTYRPMTSSHPDWEDGSRICMNVAFQLLRALGLIPER